MLSRYGKWIALVGGGAVWFFIVMIITYVVFKAIHLG